MKSVICAVIGVSSLLLVAEPVEAARKPAKVLETRNSPAMAWTCKMSLSGSRATTLKGRFTETRTSPKLRKGSPESYRAAAIDVQTDEFGMFDWSTLMAINDAAFFDENQFNYLVSSQTKNNDALLTMKFEFLLATNSGSVVILRWGNSGHSVEGVGLCSVLPDSGAPR